MATSKSCDMPIDDLAQTILVGKLLQPLEIGPGGLRVIGPGRHGHQSGELQVLAGAHGLDQRIQRFRSGSGLRFFRRQLHLDHDVERFALAIQAPREFRRIDGLDHLKQARRDLAFVRLQVPDEMKSRVLQRRQFGELVLELLDIIFSEIPDAQFERFFYNGRGEFLGHSQQRYFARIAGGTRGCGFDPAAYVF